MLLPSALICDSRSPLQSSLPCSRLFSPPPTPDSSSHFATPILNTCRALQSLLGVYPAPQVLNKKPKAYAPRTKVAKRSPPVSRGKNKRCRDLYEKDNHSQKADQENRDSQRFTYSTPKRQCRAPNTLPRGILHQDFHALNSPAFEVSLPAPQQPSDTMAECSLEPPIADPALSWDSDDDSALVDLVLDKLKLSRGDWDDCARVLGKDQATLGRRWKHLLGEGQVGLQFRRGGGRRDGGRKDVRELWR